MSSMIDRDLMAKDLASLAILLAPAIEARMAFLDPLFSMPIVGPRLRSQLRGSPQAMLSDALVRLLDLTDDELAGLIDTIGYELGAWRGYNEPASGWAELRPAYDHLLEVS